MRTDSNTNSSDNRGLPLGEIVENWSPPPRPHRRAMAGRYCTVEPLSIEKHSADLFAANRRDHENRIWVYLPYGPFDTPGAYQKWLADACLGDDPLFFSIIDRRTGRAAGVASYLRIDPAAGSIEVGHINYSPALQHTAAATEAMYLMMENAFALGYRRYEWKCHALNARSRAAAMRLGFTFEGVFRQAAVSKGRNRDTAWYAVIDQEWAALEKAFQTWLAADNFDDDGVQRESLSVLTKDALTP
ncbi:MAG: GNAT family protein [Gammaproteobacteria bacterium]|nr:GNAT family protein [Gammaproteobacteria bacterium]